MIGRVVLLLIAVAIVLAMIGKLRLPRLPRRPAGKAIEPARKCPDCGAYVVGSRPEPCARPDCRFRPEPA
jgi:hypothetical protein